MVNFFLYIFIYHILSINDKKNVNNDKKKFRYASEGDGENGDIEGPLESMREHLLDTIKRTFKVSAEQASQLYSELLQCTRKKHLVSFY